MFKPFFSLFKKPDKEPKQEAIKSEKQKPGKPEKPQQIAVKEKSPKEMTLRASADILKYPRHFLAKPGKGHREIKIRIGDKKRNQPYWNLTPAIDPDGAFGIPGKMSFDFDYQVLLPKIYEAVIKAKQNGERIAPRYVVVGSLREIAKQLGLKSPDTVEVKKAIMSNQAAVIETDKAIRFFNPDGQVEYLSGQFKAYDVFVRGDDLPDGDEAKKVILELSIPFWQAVNSQIFFKPLDGRYFKSLKAPGAQRWYTLISTDIFVALNKRLPQAKRRYSEYCLYHPQVRHTYFSKMKAQMDRLHGKHLEQNYVESVEYEKTEDDNGVIDWWLIYKPGKKAIEEYNQFKPSKSKQKPKQITSSNDQLVIELVKRGITEAIAQDLASQHPDRIKPQIEYFDFLAENHSEKVSQNPAGFLRASIEKDYNAPANYTSPEERKRRAKQAEQQKKRQDWQTFKDNIKTQIETSSEKLVYGSMILWVRNFEKEHQHPPTTEDREAKQQELINALPTKEELINQLKDKYQELFNKPLKDTEQLFDK